MKLKRYSLLALIVGVLLLAAGLLIPYISLVMQTKQDGLTDIIIDGADAPTYDFWLFGRMDGLPFVLVLLGTALLLSALFCLLLPRVVGTHCRPGTTALALGCSADIAVGITCGGSLLVLDAFDEVSRHPVEYAVSVLLGFACLFILLFLLVFYVKARKKTPSVKGVFIDLLTGLVYLPVFFIGVTFLYNLIG